MRDIVIILVVIGLLSSMLFLGEVLFEFFYDICPRFRNYIDRKLDELPDWE